MFLAWFPPANGLAAESGSPLSRIAAAYSVRPAQIALAWLIARSNLLVPLPGTHDAAWFEEDLEALEIDLATADIELLSAAA